MANSLRILLVDPSDESYKTFSEAARVAGFELVYASSYSEGISLCEKIQPQIIFSELVLEESDGVDLLMTARDHIENVESILVIYTKVQDQYSEVAAFNAGVDDYLRKAYSTQLLASKIKALQRRVDRVNGQNQKLGNAC
jgi:two-component system alkaline phosphatase synthesis response regulator PhoP